MNSIIPQQHPLQPSFHAAAAEAEEKVQMLDIEEARRPHFNPGVIKNCVGHSQLAQQPVLANLGAQRQWIEGDGSCWARSLWQVVFNTIFNDAGEYDRFVENVAKSPYVFHGDPIGINVDQELAKKTIKILHLLESMDAYQRIDYLNHENVDDTLVSFMRHVAGEYTRDNRIFATEEEINKIKYTHRSGGSEMDAFMSHFQLTWHSVCKVGENWIYRKTSPKIPNIARLDNPININNLENKPRVAMFGVNGDHFEVISFPMDITQNNDIVGERIETPNVLNAFDDYAFAQNLQAEFDKIEKQIKDDRILAEKLQAKEKAKHQQELDQKKLDAEIARKLHEEINHKKPVAPVEGTGSGSGSGTTPPPPPEPSTNVKPALHVASKDEIKKEYFDKLMSPSPVSGKTFLARVGSCVVKAFQWIGTFFNRLFYGWETDKSLLVRIGKRLEADTLSENELRTIETIFRKLKKRLPANNELVDVVAAQIDSRKISNVRSQLLP